MKTKFLPLSGFMAFLIVVSCTEPIEVNPNFNSETKEVTTQFVLSVNTGSPQTKMTATSVQRASNFLGIDQAHVHAYKTGMSEAAFNVEPFVLNSLQETDRDYPLGVLYSNGSIDAANNASSSSNRIVQLNVPVDVDAILFYGKSINASPSNATGRLSFNVDEIPAKIHFDLVKRLEDETSYKHTGDLMVFIINRIIKSSVTAMGSSDTYTATGDPNDPKTVYKNLPALTWKELGDKFANPTLRSGLSGLEEILGAAYSTFANIETGEYRAGSSAAIKGMMASLINVVRSVQDANPTGDEEANACRLADQIMSRKGHYFTDAMEFQSVSTIKDNVIGLNILTEEQWNTQFSGVDNITSFPHTQFHIPDGAAQLNYRADIGEFEYLDHNQALANPGNEFNPNDYLYPSEIAYYVNSPIRTTSQDVATTDYPNGVTPWDDDQTSGNKWAAKSWQSNSRVQSNTRGIAVRNNINYGVALLESKVAIQSDLANFKDNKALKTGDANDNLIPTNNHHLTLTGILVGGQPKSVDWQFLPKSDATFTYVVFDDAVASGTIPTPAGNENYTLVFDNYNKTLGDALGDDDQTQSAVKVALEFKNEGDPFWGKDNLVPKDGIFYLIAELPVSSTTGGSVLTLPTWPDASKYAIPPVYGIDNEDVPSGKVAGHSKQINRVFIQNFVTSATFTLGENSLKNAYVTVPNLSSTQMSLGLSVDLKWHTGYTYNINL